MKKNILIKAMGMMMACALVVGNTGIVAHATEYDDGCVREDRESSDSNGGGASLDIGGGSSSNSGNSGSSSSGGGSSYTPSYDDGCARETRESGSASGGGAALGDSGSASYSAPAPKAAGSTASAGKEQFRAVAKAGDGTYKVIHKGVDIATFHLMKTDKTAVSCTKVALKQRDDGKWAINYEVADATDLTVGAPLDRTYMYNTLGVSYVTINDTVIIDIEAEAAATK